MLRSLFHHFPIYWTGGYTSHYKSIQQFILLDYKVEYADKVFNYGCHFCVKLSNQHWHLTNVQFFFLTWNRQTSHFLQFRNLSILIQLSQREACPLFNTIRRMNQHQTTLFVDCSFNKRYKHCCSKFDGL